VKSPFDRFKQGFVPTLPNVNPAQGPAENQAFLRSTQTVTPQGQKLVAQGPVPNTVVNFPMHLYQPLGVITLDLRVSQSIAATTEVELISFTGPIGQITRFIGYSVVSTLAPAALITAPVYVLPRLGTSRLLPGHGNPLNEYRIEATSDNLLRTFDLIPCQIVVPPGSTMTWTVENTGAAPSPTAIRLIGYQDNSQIRSTGRFGG
jgi:hypothetical protein